MSVMSESAPTLLVEHSATEVVTLLLNRPARRNALDAPLVEALLEAFSVLEPRAFVLGTADPRCFCAGADLSLDDAARARVSDRLYELYRAMLLSPAPIVAALEGPAVGGGAQLAVAADLRVAAPSATLRFAGPGHGLAVGAWALPGLVGRGRALDLCLTMRPVVASAALQIGLVDRVQEDPRAGAEELAVGLAALEPGAVERVRAVVRGAAGALDALDSERRGNLGWSGSVEAL